MKHLNFIPKEIGNQSIFKKRSANQLGFKYSYITANKPYSTVVKRRVLGAGIHVTNHEISALASWKTHWAGVHVCLKS